MQYSGNEKRRFIRANIPCKIIIYLPAEHTISTHTENIGAGGVCVVINEKLDIFSSVSFELYIQQKTITGKGRIVWVVDKPLEAGGGIASYDTGIEFRQIAAADQKIIGDFVDRVIENRQ